MSKPKLTLFVVVASLCFFGLLIFGLVEIGNRHSGESENSNLNSTSNPHQNLAQGPGEKGEHGDSGINPSEPNELSNSAENRETTTPNWLSAIVLHSISSCDAASDLLPPPRSTKQWIYPYGHESTEKVQVLCDFEGDGVGWTVIQKRSSGPQQEFNRNWTEYAKGFGSLDGNFWLGLENIHALTKNGDQQLRIELEDFEGNKAWAKYSSFSVSAASDFYRLSVSGFSGNAGDRLTISANNGMRFSTKDKDNDLHPQSCVQEFAGGGGWWFNHCGWGSHLNGPYREKGEIVSDDTGIFWESWKGLVSLAKTEMKIRQR